MFWGFYYNFVGAYRVHHIVHPCPAPVEFPFYPEFRGDARHDPDIPPGRILFSARLSYRENLRGRIFLAAFAERALHLRLVSVLDIKIARPLGPLSGYYNPSSYNWISSQFRHMGWIIS